MHGEGGAYINLQYMVVKGHRSLLFVYIVFDCMADTSIAHSIPVNNPIQYIGLLLLTIDADALCPGGMTFCVDYSLVSRQETAKS